MYTYICGYRIYIYNSFAKVYVVCVCVFVQPDLTIVALAGPGTHSVLPIPVSASPN